MKPSVLKRGHVIEAGQQHYLLRCCTTKDARYLPKVAISYVATGYYIIKLRAKQAENTARCQQGEDSLSGKAGQKAEKTEHPCGNPGYPSQTVSAHCIVLAYHIATTRATQKLNTRPLQPITKQEGPAVGLPLASVPANDA